MANDAYEVMDLKALRCFWAMAKHESLTQAGIELGISEAAVSQRVKSLERYLHTKLYETRGGRVRLTPAGERTMDKAISVFAELEAFEQSIASGEENAEITLCTLDAALRYLIPAAVARFSREHPLARLRLLARSVEDCTRLNRRCRLRSTAGESGR
jgi:DNA-binding transcriptional LysR family regulator